MDEEKFGELFAKAFKDVVMPSLEDMHSDVKVLKGDVKVLKEDVKTLQETTDRIERKLAAHDNHFDRVDDKLVRHEKEIKSLQSVL